MPSRPPAPTTASGGRPILSVRGLSKSFGGLKAVQDVELRRSARARSSASSARTGQARPRSSTCSTASSSRMPGRSFWTAATWSAQAAPAVRSRRGPHFPDHAPVSRACRWRTTSSSAPSCTRATDAEARRAAAEAIARVGLSDFADRLAGELTTQHLRLMELARALAGRPRILLLDETLAGLGHSEAEEVIGIVRRLAQDGITIVIIEHTMQAMVRLVDRFVVLDHGAVLVEGAPETSRATRASSRPISARNGRPMLKVDGISAGYSALPVIERRVDRGGRRAVRVDRRPERRRQDHAVQDDLRHPDADVRHRSASRISTSPPCPPRAGRISASPMCRRAGRCSHRSP